MGDFHNSRIIKATGKPHMCEQCQTEISQGSPAFYGSGRYDGDFYTVYCHIECHDAARNYADLHGLYGEDWPWFSQYHEQEDEQWMRDHHPLVADRLGWAKP